MAKRLSWKFWITFWLTALIFLAGWFFYWETRNQGTGKLETLVNLLPGTEEMKGEYKSIASLFNYFSNTNGQEKNLLVLFQNNLEIRPGGGFIGTFGIAKIKDGHVQEFKTYDTGVFDANMKEIIAPPYPITETMKVKAWALRDSNYSPDFATNARKAEEFYHLEGGTEKLDGVIAITTNVLTSLLKLTGPITLEDYPGTYSDENAILALEYQVEKAYDEQGIAKNDRKSIINELANAIKEKTANLSIPQKYELFKILMEDLKKKDIQMYFKDATLQKEIEKSNWGGLVDSEWKKDYLLAVDANYGAYKSDYYVKRSMDYSIDLTGETPKVILKITYNHTAKQRDFMTKDYITYLRVYAPDGAWLDTTLSKNLESPKFGNEFGKKYFGTIVRVPLGSEKTVVLEYTLPKEIANSYNLKIQKQAGINDVPVAVHVTDAQGKKDFNYALNSDIVINN
jgi:hypothetical protein